MNEREPADDIDPSMVDGAPTDGSDGEAEPLDEVRDAAAEVLLSLKRLLDAAERALEDPSAFDRMVSSGRGLVEAFTAGFTADPSDPPADDEGEQTAGGA